MTESAGWYGKFRGSVVDNADPERLGRVRVLVPDVLGSVPSSWAMPCVPVAGPQMGVWIVPPVGAGVWVEFEQGDPDYPIWVGGWWGTSAEVPGAALAGPTADAVILLQTRGGTGVVLSDVPGPTGGVTLRIAGGAVIEVSQVAITISNGQGASIVLSGPTISFNGGQMTVP